MRKTVDGGFVVTDVARRGRRRGVHQPHERSVVHAVDENDGQRIIARVARLGAAGKLPHLGYDLLGGPGLTVEAPNRRIRTVALVLVGAEDRSARLIMTKAAAIA